MLERLFKTKTAGPSRDARVPAGRRIYAIGDIHGRLDLLQTLLGRIERDAAAARTSTRPWSTSAITSTAA